MIDLAHIREAYTHVSQLLVERAAPLFDSLLFQVTVGPLTPDLQRFMSVTPQPRDNVRVVDASGVVDREEDLKP